jgi:hypothetical protein
MADQKVQPNDVPNDGSNKEVREAADRQKRSDEIPYAPDRSTLPGTPHGNDKPQPAITPSVEGYDKPATQGNPSGTAPQPGKPRDTQHQAGLKAEAHRQHQRDKASPNAQTRQHADSHLEENYRHADQDRNNTDPNAK